MTTQELVDSLGPEQSAALLAYRDEINASRDAAMQEFRDLYDAAAAERDASTVQLATRTTERDEALAENAPLIEQVATLTAANEALLNPPFDPRVVSPYAFVSRYTTDERIAILTSAKTDVNVGLILAELQTVQRVRLDVEATKNGVGYLQSIGIINAERAAVILADATADEAP